MKNQLSKLNLRFEDLKGEKLTSEKLNEVKGGETVRKLQKSYLTKNIIGRYTITSVSFLCFVLVFFSD